MGANVIIASHPCRCTGTIGIYQITRQAQWMCGACGGNGVGPREYFATPITITIEPPPRSLADTLAEVTKSLSDASKKSRVRQRPCKRHRVVACQAHPCL